MDTNELIHLIAYAFDAHSRMATSEKMVRKWDGKTPYVIHPIWCAMTILSETNLPEDVRNSGAAALILHDVLEDTTMGLPEGLHPVVIELVHQMTFTSFAEEKELVWDRGIEVMLLKIFDKVHNLLDGAWMSKEKRRMYEVHLARLCREVENVYPHLNIIRIARSVMG